MTIDEAVAILALDAKAPGLVKPDMVALARVTLRDASFPNTKTA